MTLPHFRPAARRARVAALVLALLGTLVALGVPATAGAAPAVADDLPEPALGRPWFGPEIDVEEGRPLDYAERLGESPSSVTVQVDYPLADDDRTYLERQVRSIATLGAVVVLDVQPRVALRGLTAAHAEDLVAVLDQLTADVDTFFLLRFGAEMNGTWEPWGQQPGAYVRAFRTLADVVHSEADRAQTVWAPVYGSGYPFRSTRRTQSLRDDVARRNAERLDTDGSGRVDPGDDPYGPYYPGDEAVDWVGLAVYRLGQDQGLKRNTLPPRDELTRRFEETWGYGAGGGRRSFYERFAEPTGQRVLVQTAALWNPGVPGFPERTVKRAWWRQVFAAPRDYPLIGLVSWLEMQRVEPEVGDRPVDWRVTADPGIARAVRADLRRSPVDLGPVTRVVEPPPEPSAAEEEPPAEERREPGAPSDVDVAPGLHPEPGLTALAVAGGVLALLMLVAVAGGSRRTAPAVDGRDPRIDLARGVLLVGTVLLAVEVALGERGPVSRTVAATVGIEGFVLLTGLLVGLSGPGLAARVGEVSAAGVRWRRAFAVWAAAVLATLVTYAVVVVPGVDGSAVTRSPDSGLDLFPNARRLFDYPPPWDVVRELFVLRIGPWPLAGLGLFVVLLVAAPLVVAVVRRGGWWVVLPASWALYGYGLAADPDWLTTQAEETFPPLLHQVVLVHGIVLAHHRGWLARWVHRPAARAAGVVAVAAYAGVLAVARATGGGGWVLEQYDGALPPGRLVTLAVVALVAATLLTRGWRPLGATVGRVLVPVGRRPLLVVLLLVPLVLVAGALG